MIRYRRDIPGGDEQLISDTVQHVSEHLRGAANSYDDPYLIDSDLVDVRVVSHVDGDESLVSVIGSLDAAPVASYLQPDFDPAADHPDIVFVPYDEPDNSRFFDYAAYMEWQRESR